MSNIPADFLHIVTFVPKWQTNFTVWLKNTLFGGIISSGLYYNRLPQEHAFDYQKAVPFISEKLGVSRYTIYNYLKLGQTDD